MAFGLCVPSPLETPTLGWAIIKSRLYREAAKVGGGLWPPVDNAFALKYNIVRLCISEQKRQRKEKQKRCNI